MLAPASLWLHPASTFPRAAAGLTGFALVWTALQVLAWRISPLSHPSSDAAATAFILVLQMLTYAVFMHPLTLSLNAWHQALLLTPQHHDKAMQPLLQDGADSASIAGSSSSWRKCWSSARRPFVRLGRLLFNPGSATGVWVRLACWNLLLFFADSLPRTLQYLYRLSWPYSLHLRQLIGPTLQQWIGPYWPWLLSTWIWPILIGVTDSVLFPIWYRRGRAVARRSDDSVVTQDPLHRDGSAAVATRPQWQDRSLLWLFWLLCVCLINPIWPYNLWLQPDWVNQRTVGLQAAMRTVRLFILLGVLLCGLMTEERLHCRSAEHRAYLSLRRDFENASRACCSCVKWRLVWLAYVVRWSFWVKQHSRITAAAAATVCCSPAHCRCVPEQAFMQYDLGRWFWPTTVQTGDSYDWLLKGGSWLQTGGILATLTMFFTVMAVWTRLTRWLARDVLPAQCFGLVVFPFQLFESVFSDAITLTIAEPFSWLWLLLVTARSAKAITRELNLVSVPRRYCWSRLLAVTDVITARLRPEGGRSAASASAALSLRDCLAACRAEICTVDVFQQLLAELCSKSCVIAVLLVDLLPAAFGGYMLALDTRQLSPGQLQRLRLLLLAATVCHLVMQLLGHLAVLHVLRRWTAAAPSQPSPTQQLQQQLLDPSPQLEMADGLPAPPSFDRPLSPPLSPSAPTALNKPAFADDLMSSQAAAAARRQASAPLAYWSRHGLFFLYVIIVGGQFMVRDAVWRLSFDNRLEKSGQRLW